MTIKDIKYNLKKRYNICLSEKKIQAIIDEIKQTDCEIYPISWTEAWSTIIMNWLGYE